MSTRRVPDVPQPPPCILHTQDISVKNWDRAQASCIARGGRLFSVRDDLEALWLEQYMRQKILCSFKDEMLVDMHKHLYCMIASMAGAGRTAGAK